MNDDAVQIVLALPSIVLRILLQIQFFWVLHNITYFFLCKPLNGDQEVGWRLTYKKLLYGLVLTMATIALV